MTAGLDTTFTSFKDLSTSSTTARSQWKKKLLLLDFFRCFARVFSSNFNICVIRKVKCCSAWLRIYDTVLYSLPKSSCAFSSGYLSNLPLQTDWDWIQCLRTFLLCNIVLQSYETKVQSRIDQNKREKTKLELCFSGLHMRANTHGGHWDVHMFLLYLHV